MIFSSQMWLSFILLLSTPAAVHSFTIRPTQTTPFKSALSLHSTRPRSRVSDPTGPTPSKEQGVVDTIKLEDIPELQYDPDGHPVAHQPWRRGETDGCHDPIDAAWRQQAEDIMYKAVDVTGGTIIDITWYLTHIVVTIDEDLEEVHKDYLKERGPVIEVSEPESPMYKDPADPNPDDIWSDEEEVMYQKDEETEEDLQSKKYSRQEDGEEDLGLDPEEDVPLYASQESREDDALRVAEEAELLDERREGLLDVEAISLDTPALSLIAGAILDALETVEDELRVLDRHELVLASPGAEDVLETQSQFDAHRGYDVAVETQDPWESNRTLRGKLVDRNAMDIIINQQGRMVTIPLNFVKCVRVPQSKRDREGDAEENSDLGGANGEKDIYED